jgi:hypothetical protein
MIEIRHKDGAVLHTVNFDTLSGANLSKADLSGADLSKADLSWASLREADLRGANLSKADLRGANLREADLRGANLCGADLSRADLCGADLRGASLREADLRGADLRCKQYVCQIHASRHAIVAIDNDVQIGCIRKLLAEWLETLQAVGRENEYTDAEIAEYGGWLRQIAAVLAARRGEVAG